MMGFVARAIEVNRLTTLLSLSLLIASVGRVTAEEPTYVGRDACRECHAENYQLHSSHGHKHSFATTDDPKIIELFDGKSFDAGEPFGTFTYHADDQGLYALLPKKFGDRPFRLNYALGSPEIAVTLLSLVPDPVEGTVAIEHRASWYDRRGALGPTPLDPIAPRTPAEMFGLRHEGTVMERCIYCHTTRATIENQQITDLIPNVNCEKCHGPASLHVEQARSMPNPPKFSVGKKDWDAESEIQLCGDCHRLPVTVSKKKLRDYPDELTRFQPVGMLRSACYVKSKGRMRCSTCHNPHQSVTEVSRKQHIQNCIACHREDNPEHVLCPKSTTEGCIECHMPEKDLPGLDITFHDHWIRVIDE